MPTIIHTLRDKDPESIATLHALCIQMFLDGDCYAFAMALSEGLGYPMIGLMDGNTVRHVAIELPDGMLHDARGSLSRENLGKPFGLTPPYTFQIVDPKNLVRKGESPERVASTMRLARRLAECIWPELPWKQSLAHRVAAFATDLETLSRKHGLWIRSPFPTATPVLAEGGNDERGYVLKPTVDGSTFTLDRYFR